MCSVKVTGHLESRGSLSWLGAQAVLTTPLESLRVYWHAAANGQAACKARWSLFDHAVIKRTASANRTESNRTERQAECDHATTIAYVKSASLTDVRTAREPPMRAVHY